MTKCILRVLFSRNLVRLCEQLYISLNQHLVTYENKPRASSRQTKFVPDIREYNFCAIHSRFTSLRDCGVREQRNVVAFLLLLYLTRQCRQKFIFIFCTCFLFVYFHRAGFIICDRHQENHQHSQNLAVIQFGVSASAGFMFILEVDVISFIRLILSPTDFAKLM